MVPGNPDVGFLVNSSFCVQSLGARMNEAGFMCNKRGILGFSQTATYWVFSVFPGSPFCFIPYDCPQDKGLTLTS